MNAGHGRHLGPNFRRKGHTVEQVAPDIDAGCDFDQAQAAFDQREHRTFGDVKDVLALTQRFGSRKGDLINCLYELLYRAVLLDTQLPFARCHLGPFGIKGANKHHFACVLRNVDKAAGADWHAAQLGGVDVALRIDLAKTQKGDIQATAGVEIELRWSVDHARRILRIAEQRAGQKPAAVGAMLDGLIIEPLLSARRNNSGNFVWNAIAIVDNSPLAQFLAGAVGNDTPRAKARVFGQRQVVSRLT